MNKIIGVFVVIGMLLLSVTAFADERFVFSDMTVKDKRTGLIWSRDAKLGQRDWKGAFELVKGLNSDKYAGFKDWRVPTEGELMILIEYAKSLGYSRNNAFILFNKMGFYDVQSYKYWTSKEYSADSASMETFGDCQNCTDTVYKSNSYWVWPVRGGK